MAGLNLDPWQQWVLRHSLGESANGKWAAAEVGLVVGRQNGKNAVLEARELAELYLVPQFTSPRTIIHSAHQFATALEHFRRVKRRVMDTPELLRRVKGPVRRGVPAGIRDSHGEESIELEDGSRLLFKARTSSSGQGAGFTCDLLVFDEAWNLPESLIGMVVPTLAAKSLETPGVQTWYTSQTVNQASMPYGLHLARVRDRGIKGQDPRLFYAEWSVDEAAFLRNRGIASDPVYWAMANPGLGLRISLEHVEWEFRGGMPWVEFLAHRLGVGDWPDISEDAGRIVPRALWEAAAEHDPENRIVRPPIFAIDSDPNMTRASIAVSGQREDGLFNGAVVDSRHGTHWIVDRCKELKRDNPGMRVVVHRTGPIGSHIDDLKRAKIRVIEATNIDYGHACLGFIAGVTEKRFRYPFPQPELDDAVRGAKAKDGEAMKWTRKDAETDISPLVAVTLAYWGAERAKRTQVVDMDELYRKIAEEDADAVDDS